MAMNMSLRFETSNQGGSLVRSIHKEKERILKDELLAERQLQIQKEGEINLKSEWSEGLEEASYRKRLKQHKADVKSELSFASKAVVATRRAALRNFLEQEHLMLEKELHSQGNAFYVQRV